MLRGLLNGAGKALRETGQALDRAGSSLMGNYAFKEQLSRHRCVCVFVWNVCVYECGVRVSALAVLVFLVFFSPLVTCFAVVLCCAVVCCGAHSRNCMVLR
jgi:hypothetical protein